MQFRKHQREHYIVAGSVPERRKAGTGGDADFEALIASGAWTYTYACSVSVASSASSAIISSRS
uniref:Uncharacterized protein n=1 Tax=Picea glauca TaxID=3330 RepID=A0A101LW55_PICGL|nr:hypothetical protein ABT39_MTgene1764 [Picea glauca]QHR88403.1 hypothetical protein Q903MT_gene2416 [Picea sitchensis]